MNPCASISAECIGNETCLFIVSIGKWEVGFIQNRTLPGSGSWVTGSWPLEWRRVQHSVSIAILRPLVSFHSSFLISGFSTPCLLDGSCLQMSSFGLSRNSGSLLVIPLYHGTHLCPCHYKNKTRKGSLIQLHDVGIEALFSYMN